MMEFVSWDDCSIPNMMGKIRTYSKPPTSISYYTYPADWHVAFFGQQREGGINRLMIRTGASGGIVTVFDCLWTHDLRVRPAGDVTLQ